MAQDHYVAQTYLRAFADPANEGKLHVYRKSDLGYFTPPPAAICKSLNWDQNPKYLQPADALGQWLKIFEPNWAPSVERLAQNYHLTPADKMVLSGYWAHLATCTPTAQRVFTDLQQADLEETHTPNFIEHIKANPDKYPDSEGYLGLLKDGTIRLEIDENYPKAVLTRNLMSHAWALYHQEWIVVWNYTEEPFLTSDNPSCFDYEYGDALRAARYLPLSPKLALWTMVDPINIPKFDRDSPPAKKSGRSDATLEFVRKMNVLMVKSAEKMVIASEARAYIPACVAKYRDWSVQNAAPIRIPAPDGYYEVRQTRACPNTEGSDAT